VPVAAGCGASLSSRPLHNWTSYLENHLPNQDASCLPEARLPKADPRPGVDFLIDTILAGAGDIVPVTIGALTNLAMAMVKEPRIIARIPRIVAIAAEFRAGFAEWNIKCDPEAARLVVASGIPIDFTTWHIGNVASFTDADLARLGGGTSPLVRNLVAAIAEWRKGWGRYPSLFDPLAVATMIRPELCTWKRGTVAVELQGDATYGFTTFAEDAKDAAKPGRHPVAWDVDRAAALGFYLDRLLGFTGS